MLSLYCTRDTSEAKEFVLRRRVNSAIQLMVESGVLVLQVNAADLYRAETRTSIGGVY